jgi:diguanylate cyclase (GGDEF)-like protein
VHHDGLRHDRAADGGVDDAHAQLAVAYNELRRTALVDTVTGTLTRRAFAEGVGLEVAKAGFGAVLMLEMDDLKHVNDEHGHSAGDALLRHLAEVLRPELRRSDKLHRWGGDEFLLVLPGAEAAPADARIRAVFAGAPSLCVEPTGALLQLSISVGSAAYTSADDIAAAIDSADAAMWRVKSGRKFGRSSGTVA